MWPYAHIFMYGMESNSKILYIATQTIPLKRQHHEHVRIRKLISTLLIYIEFIFFLKTEVRVPTTVTPGQDITMRFKAVTNSYVGLVAVDNRILELDNTPLNDFDETYFDVIKEKLKATSDLEQGNVMASKLGLLTMTTTKFVADANTGKSNIKCMH